MRSFSLYLLLALSAFVARAQRNYVPAVIVDRQNDSLRGFIDYRNWNKSPDEISFKRERSGEPQRFTPADIRAFLVLPENELYVSRQLKVDVTPQHIDHLMGNPERTYLEDTVFLLNIVEGAANLYVYGPAQPASLRLRDGRGRCPGAANGQKKGW